MAKDFIRLAMKVARKSPCSFKIGALVVKGGRVLSWGHNKDKTDPIRIRRPNPYVDKLHAELVALHGITETGGCTLYVVRVGRVKSMALAKPCRMCMEMIRKAKIRKLIYSTDDGMICERVV
jgi:tRNA(Arg) A34 adenosine deaminase TadA